VEVSQVPAKDLAEEVIMKREQLPLYAVALAIAVVGLLALGVPLGSLLLLLVVIACPLMMFFMMRGMHGGEGHDHGDTDRSDDADPLHKHHHGSSGSSRP
jgi:type III secretory pathway component EscV